MFRLSHILTPSHWPHTGRAPNRLPVVTLLQKSPARRQPCLWAHVLSRRLPHLSPVLTLALGEVLPRPQRSGPAGLSLRSCRVIPLAQLQKGPHPGKSRPRVLAPSPHCPFPSKRRCEAKNPQGEEEERKTAAWEPAPRCTISRSLIPSSRRLALWCQAALRCPLSLNLLRCIVFTWLPPLLDFKLLEGSGCTALANRVIFI